MLGRDEVSELLELALDLAAAASARIMPHFRTCMTETKADGSEVTAADHDAEEEIRRLLGLRCPNHRVVGEEFGGTIDPAEPYTWVVDPIDGTTYFALGLPAFGTLVSLLHFGEPIVGVIGFPAADETVYAASDLGCWHRIASQEPVRARVAADVALGEAFCSASGSHASDIQAGPDAPKLSRLIRAAGKFRFLGDCQQHALLCRGTYTPGGRHHHEALGHGSACPLHQGSRRHRHLALRRSGRRRVLREPSCCLRPQAPRSSRRDTTGPLDAINGLTRRATVAARYSTGDYLEAAG